MTFDMRSRRFWNESDTSWKYQAKICAQVYFPQEHYL